MASMRTAAVGVLLVLQAAACTPGLQHGPSARDQGACDNGAEMPLGDDLNDAETRWRRELAGELARVDGDSLAGSPGDASTYCAESSDDGTASDAAPLSSWDRIKSGADKVGKATFAAVSIAISVGMMVAPFLML